MASYICNACSYTGKRFPGGRCPGCDSFNISKIADERPEPVARKPYRLALAAALWVWLLIEIYRQLSA